MSRHEFDKMLLVTATRDGENFDLFVVARTAEDAITIWRDHNDFHSTEYPDRIFVAPTSIGSRSRAIPWSEEVPELWPNDCRL